MLLHLYRFEQVLQADHETVRLGAIQGKCLEGVLALVMDKLETLIIQHDEIRKLRTSDTERDKERYLTMYRL